LEEEPTTDEVPESQEPIDDTTDVTFDAGGSDAPEQQDRYSATPDQDARDRRTWLLLIAAGGVVLVLFLVAFWPVMRGRLDAAKQLDEAQALLAQARGSVSDIDAIVARQLSADPAVTAPDISAQVLVAKRELKQVDALIDQAMPHLTDDEQRQATLIREAADARLAMVASAAPILKVSAKSARALELANAGWQQTQAADRSEAKANAAYAKQTAIGVRSSADLYSQASAQLKAASTLYSQAASAFPEAGYTRYADQTNQRVGALKLATASTVSWLAGNQALAKTQHAQYVARSAKAAAVAKTLPQPPGRAAADAFEKLAGGSRQAYEAARAKAMTADDSLKSL